MSSKEGELNDPAGMIESFLAFLCTSCGACHACVKMSVHTDGHELVIIEDSFAFEEDRFPLRTIPCLNHEIQFPADSAAGNFSHDAITRETAVLNGRTCYGPGCMHDLRVGGTDWKLCGLERGEWLFAGSIDDIRTELYLRFSPVPGSFFSRNLDIAGSFLHLLQQIAANLHLPETTTHGFVDPAASRPEIEGEWAGQYLYGVSGEINALRGKIGKVALSGIPVLVEGENGTGKEIVCRGIHSLGPRRNRPLVIVNCMEMPGSLLQSELFGHVRGSFTGAHADKKGLIENSAGGTFFLDEIGEMPLHLQASLLRVIQEKEIRRIGESTRRQVDVRFVFATNRDLKELVEQKRGHPMPCGAFSGSCCHSSHRKEDEDLGRRGAGSLDVRLAR
jgi:hypothetical protein